MNLAGNQAKNLFKSIRTGNRPSVVGMWAAATVVDQIRKRKRPEKELLLRKKLKPGESYVIRVPGEGEGPLAEQVPSDTVIAEVADTEESIGTQLLSAATGLLSAAAEAEAEPITAEPAKPQRTSRRQARKERKAAKAELAEEATPRLSRRKRRRQARLAALHEADLDRDALPRRRSRKLKRRERKAEKRPTRRRTRKAQKQQKKAQKTLGRIARKQSKLPRADRKLARAEQEVARRQAKVDKRSTRRRRRKLKKAEKAVAKRQR